MNCSSAFSSSVCPSAAALFESERLQDVVHVGGVEIEPRLFAGAERAGTLEESNAVLIENHLLHRQVSRLRHNGAHCCAQKRRAQKQGNRYALHDASIQEMPHRAVPFQAICPSFSS